MNNLFEFCITKEINLQDIKSILAEWNPHWVIKNNIEDVDFSMNEGCVLETSSHDPDWKIIDFYLPEECSDFFEIDLANKIHSKTNCSILIGSVEVVSGLDPHDPYWDLLLEKGDWFFVSTAETQIMGPYICVSEEEMEYRPIKKIQKIDLSNPSKGMYTYRDGVLVKSD